jgi:prolyl-tRNA synthetase
MRASSLNIVTLREDPADAEIASHRLLMRSGFLHKSGAGIYLYGPLMHRVIRKVCAVVAEEISRAGGLEITMPILQEEALWERSGRWSAYLASKTMLVAIDRNGQKFGLAPTAEEVVTDYASAVVKSYRQLPVTFFQQHTKFRDEIRPRFGLMRGKEFLMMDAYSFHDSDASLDQTYEAMRQAYHRAFRRMGLEAFAVEADSGAIGGSGSNEFMVAATVGEDSILFCPQSGYAANVERAQGVFPQASSWKTPAGATKVHTPNAGGIGDVVAYLNINGYADLTAAHMLKTILFMAKSTAGEFKIAACVRGDREVNEVKLTNAVTRLLGDRGPVLQLRPMHPQEVQAATGAAVGFAGPGSGLKVDLCMVDANCEKADSALVTGANQTDHHLVGFTLKRDAAVTLNYADITKAVAGDGCPRSGQPLQEKRGIEVGHIFKLGTKYSASMKAEFTGQDGKLHPFIMGCYGIGSSRVAAAAIEQHHDDNGMCWPLTIAPFHCVVVPVGKPGDQLVEGAAQAIYHDLLKLGVEAVYDDRDLKPGVKFKDWDLIGIPLRIVAGRGVAEGVVEFKARTAAAPENIPIPDAANRIAALVQAALALTY